ncbi:hypothetical protein DACRYDRAFT_103540 [Dacryopinax primogenitus]|uniref:SWR1-complex protein 4 n=1 Tax=Dacryopinax primogenitus (strain DJM 731) TaxID=1858805 RepID=M5GC44_DACPD|nr:uncharacterized protein DACRYDRAFT_103540 [Dacryopinax primogenitus]EJU06594.1 hypothetical protein DACRYDRAFT_103540 [Dacryopinax primogenitus]
MTSADVREIVSSLVPPGSTPVPRKAVAPSATRKPEGISRELYNLIGNAAPTLVAQVSRPKFKARPDLGRARVKWEFREFDNPARKDHLKLHHWQRATDTGNYRFARYNIDSAPISYIDEEYEAVYGTIPAEIDISLLASTSKEDTPWTKEDTDYLFRLVREYDQRFIVIIDRWAPPSGIDRPIEELKSRYYGVARSILERRLPEDDPNKAQTLAGFNFDKQQERKRRDYVVALFNREPEAIEEEEALYIEVKRLEQNERRFTKDREDLLRMLAGVESGLGTLKVGDEDTKKKKKNGETSADSPATPGGGSTKKSKAEAKYVPADDPTNCIVRYDPATVSVGSKSGVPSIFMRSSRIPVPKPSVATHVTQLLAELQISPNTLVMPTKVNVEKLESLLNTAGILIEMKRSVDRLDQEIRVLKARHKGENVEEVEMEHGEDKGKAVASRKRSMSIISNAANKRQRV